MAPVSAHAIDSFEFLSQRRAGTSTAAEGTALSGGCCNPKARAALLNYLVALPFRVLQVPFASSDIGIGYVVLARLR